MFIIDCRAVLASFGLAAVDSRMRPSGSLPGPSWLTGLCANALGLQRRLTDDRRECQMIQSTMRYGAVELQQSLVLMDYQTADLGQPHLRESTWDPQGRPYVRGGGSPDYLDVSEREYRSDVHIRIAMRFDDQALERRILESLHLPRRPLFFGRKSCVPSAPLCPRPVDATTIHDALCQVTPAGARCSAIWPSETGAPQGHPVRLDRRDWLKNVHMGLSYMQSGIVDGRETKEAACT